MSQATPAAPPKISRTSWLGLAALLLVGLALYLWVVIVYNTEGGYSTTVDQSGVGDVTYAADVEVMPTVFDSQTNTAALQLRFQISDVQSTLIDGKGQLTENVRFVIDDSAGTQEIRFPAGTRLAAKDITVTTQGPSWEYPFDVHTAAFDMEAETYEKQADGTLATVQSLPLGVVIDEQAQAEGGVTGWDTVVEAGTPVFEVA